MLRDLRTLVDIESPSSDPAAVARVMDVVDGWARDLGAETHALPGGTRSFHFGPADGPYLLVLTHADTVWPHGTLERIPFSTDDGILRGPGSFDMLTGAIMSVHATAILRDHLGDGLGCGLLGCRDADPVRCESTLGQVDGGTLDAAAADVDAEGVLRRHGHQGMRCRLASCSTRRGGVAGQGRVRISAPSSVMSRVCSNWADGRPSAVSTVHSSSHSTQSGVPRLSIGSMVNVIPGSMTVS